MSALDCNDELIIWWLITNTAYRDRKIYYNQLESTGNINSHC